MKTFFGKMAQMIVAFVLIIAILLTNCLFDHELSNVVSAASSFSVVGLALSRSGTNGTLSEDLNSVELAPTAEALKQNAIGAVFENTSGFVLSFSFEDIAIEYNNNRWFSGCYVWVKNSSGKTLYTAVDSGKSYSGGKQTFEIGVGDSIQILVQDKFSNTKSFSVVISGIAVQAKPHIPIINYSGDGTGTVVQESSCSIVADANGVGKWEQTTKLTPCPDNDSYLESWTANDERIATILSSASTLLPVTLTGITSQITYTASFAKIPDKIDLDIFVYNEDGGTVSCNGVTYNQGEKIQVVPGDITMTALPSSGYVFAGWAFAKYTNLNDAMSALQSSEAGSQENPLLYTITQPMAMTAVFLKINNISATVDETCTGLGTVSVKVGSSEDSETLGASYGQTVVFKAIPETGYVFDGWYTEDGTLYSDNASYSHTVKEEVDLHLKARFRIPKVEVVFGAGITSVTVNDQTYVDSFSFFADAGTVLNFKAEYNATAKDDNGYLYYGIWGWSNNATGQLIAGSAQQAELNVTLLAEDLSITVFARDVDGEMVGACKNLATGIIYASLQDACADLDSDPLTNEIIVLIKAVVLEDDLNIPSGATVLIPYDKEDHGEEIVTSTNANTKKAYGYTLTVPAGKKITVQSGGVLLVNAKQGVYSTRHQGLISGNYGLLNLDGSILVLGTLKARGIIRGDGKITAASNSKIYQFFEITDWRGGKSTLAIYSTIFPFTTYAIQNIQVETEYTYTSSLIANYFAYVSLEAAGEVKMVGTGKDAFFQMQEGASVTFKYDPKKAQTIVEAKGTISTNSISLAVTASVLGITKTITFDSADYEMPLPASFRINILESGNIIINKVFKILPDSSIHIQQGGQMTIQEGGKVYLYDIEDYEWEYASDASTGYSYNTYRCLAMSVNREIVEYDSKNTSTYITTLYPTDDATLVVDGILDIQTGGYVYSSLGNDQTDSAGNGSSSLRSTTNTGIIIISNVSTETHILECVNTTGNEKVYFAALRAHLVTCDCSDGTCEWTELSATVYFSNGSAWYTHKTEFEQNGEVLEDLTVYGVGAYGNVDAIVNGDTSSSCEFGNGYICTHWAKESETAGTKTAPYKPYVIVYTRDVTLNSSGFVLDYRLNDYIWMNAVVTIPAEGDAQLVNDYDGTIELVSGNDGTYYLVRKVLSTDLTSTFKVTLSIGEIETVELDLSFTTFANELIAKNDEHAPLVQAMINYGKAADKYFYPESATNITLSAAPSDFYNSFKEQTITTAYGTLNSFNDIVMHTTGATFRFNERLSMLVRINAAGLTEADIAQIGLLVSDSNAELRANGADGVTAYILYDPDYKKPSGTNPNAPDKSGYTEDWSNLVSFSKLDLSQMIISFDLESVDYQSRFNIRPYIVTTDGTVIYGEQYCYGLSDYIYRNYNKGYGADFQNFLYYTWVYADKALEAFS